MSCHYLVYPMRLCATYVTAACPRQLVKSFSTKHSCRGLSPLILLRRVGRQGWEGMLAAVKE